jgi:chromatin segregation and condensation protein Rec8/ScpA/Scc1 (kleisin family)
LTAQGLSPCQIHSLVGCSPVPLNALDVALLAQKALAAVQAAASLDLQPPTVRIEEMLAWLEDRLRALSAPERLPFDALWFELPSDPHRMAFLLAVLEAARSRSLEIEQAETFAPIWLARAAENTKKSEPAATP